ncbi:MAG: hypothetical protein LBG62_07370 [Candidatus Methanoplasma sp.]|nr:hypothetical protein [Candidatus Methanoplasma sp.]
MPDDLMALLNTDRGIAQAYLLGQLARADGAQKGLGAAMISRALEMFKASSDIVGCMTVRLDCKDDLIPYYESIGFRRIGGHYNDLNQMVTIL